MADIIIVLILIVIAVFAIKQTKKHMHGESPCCGGGSGTVKKVKEKHLDGPVMEFTSMIPYMEKEVALEIIKQFPVYVEFVESAIENYTQLCKTILETNKEEYEQAVHAHQYVLETFANQLEQENLTEEERREFSEKMMEEADKITELYLQQQKFHERVFKTIGGVVTLALGVTVTMLGLKAIGSDEDLPQLDDENQNVA